MADYNRSITVEDLLRRYNLEGLQRDRNRVYQLQGELTNTNGILEDFVDVTTQNMDQIKDQLDGNVTSWFYGYTPTMSNVPAVNWVTDSDKKEHIQDLFYNTDTGQVYRFEEYKSTDNIYNPVNAPYFKGGISINGDYIIRTNIAAGYMTYLSCQPNTTYTINRLLTEYGFFRIGTTTDINFVDDRIPVNDYYYVEPIPIVPGTLEPTPTTTSITTGANDNYIFIMVSTDNSHTIQDVLNSISVYPEEETVSFGWKEVTNIVGAQTLAVANASQDILDGNRRTFVVQPTPPYDVGDLWTDNTNHILYRCRTEKATGETFSMDDWVDSLKYLTNDGDVIIDSINSSKTTKTISAKNLFLEGESIDLTSKQLSIESDNFSLSQNGSVYIKNTDAMGGTFKIDNGIEGRGNKYATITADCISYVKETGGIEQYFYLGNDGNGGFGMMIDGYIDLIGDLSCASIRTGELQLPPSHAWGANPDLYCELSRSALNFYDTNIHSYYANNGCTVDGQIVSTGGMFAPFFQQTSLEEKKKNIEKYEENAIDEIKNIDIYKFNYTFEDDKDKKHVGFVIGDKYNYDKNITSNNNDGVDLYSFISVCCKAIQEQQKEIEELKEEINKLKKEE